MYMLEADQSAWYSNLVHQQQHSFNGYSSPGQAGWASNRMPPFWILLELRMVELIMTAGAIGYAKLQPKCHHQRTNNTQIFTGRMTFLSPNQQCQSTEGKQPNLVAGRKSLSVHPWHLVFLKDESLKLNSFY